MPHRVAETHPCEVCKKPIRLYHRFCSRPCKFKWQTLAYKGRPGASRPGDQNPGWKGGKTFKTCPMCAKEFRGQRIHCSMACYTKARWGTPATLGNRRHVHPKYKPMYGTCCVICGFDRAIDFAHIVRAADGGTSHQDNILVLCPNHHRLFDKNRLNDEECAIIEPLVAAAMASPNSRMSTLLDSRIPESDSIANTLPLCGASVGGDHT